MYTDEEMRKAVAWAVKTQREHSKCWNQDRAADEIGVTKYQLANLEARRSVSLGVLFRVMNSKLFNGDPDMFWDEVKRWLPRKKAAASA